MKLKVGIDFGASRIKACYKDKKGELVKIVFANRCLEGDSNSSSGTLVVKDGVLKRIGGTKGKSNRVNVKLNYEHLEEILMVIGYKIRKQLNESSDKYISLDVETLLPPRQFTSTADQFKEKLEAFKTIKATVEGVSFETIINSVSVNCEGVALLDALDMDEFAGEIDQVFLIDAGSSTLDWVIFEKDEDGWSVVDADTIMEVGGATMLSKIAATLEKEYPGNKFDADILEKKMTYLIGETQHKVIDAVGYADDVVASMKQELERAYTGGKVVVTGGAAELLMANSVFLDIFVSKGVTPILVEEDIRSFGNAVGALNS